MSETLVHRVYLNDFWNDIEKIMEFVADCEVETGVVVQFGVDDRSRYFMEMPDVLWQAMANLLFA